MYSRVRHFIEQPPVGDEGNEAFDIGVIYGDFWSNSCGIEFFEEI